ncbi:MAG: serine hydrolase [Actinomycetes bacterium]
MTAGKRSGVAAVGVLAAGFVLLAGCGSSGTATNGSSPASGSPLPFASPPAEGNPGAHSAVSIPQSQIDLAVSDLDAIVSDIMAKSGVPGLSVAVVHNDKPVYVKGFGVRKLGSPETVDDQTVFQLASLSKPVGSSVVASVVGGGSVSWDDPITKYLPAFALKDPWVSRNVTVADMYSHRSGLPKAAGDLLEDIGYDRAQVLARLRYLPLGPFRAQYAYANFGLTTGAQAVAASQNIEWSALSKQRIYDPLGMTSTSSDFADYIAAPNRAVTHAYIDGKYVPKYVRDPQAQSPAGGVSSNAADMAKWLRMELADGKFDGKQVVDSAALAQSRVPYMTTSGPQPADVRPASYGLGVGVGVDDTGRVRFSHSGAFLLGASTVVNLLPSEKLGIVVLTNGAPQGVPEAIAATFLDMVETGTISRDWFPAYEHVMQGLYTNPSKLAGKSAPTNPAPSAPLTALTGTYANPYYGPVRITVVNGKLSAAIGPKDVRFELTHWDGNTFSMMPVGENALGIAAVDFAKPVAGKSPSVTFEFFNAEGLGTFKR